MQRDKENAPVDCNAVPPPATPATQPGKSRGLEAIKQQLQRSAQKRAVAPAPNRPSRTPATTTTSSSSAAASSTPSSSEAAARKKRDMVEISAAIKHLKRAGAGDSELLRDAFDSSRAEDKARAWRRLLELVLSNKSAGRTEISRSIDFAHDFLRSHERALRSNEDYVWIRVQRPVHRNRFQDGHEAFQALVKHARIGVRSPFFYEAWMSYAREHGRDDKVPEIKEMGVAKGALSSEAFGEEETVVVSAYASSGLRGRGGEEAYAATGEEATAKIQEADEEEEEEEEDDSPPQLLKRKLTPRYDRRMAITASFEAKEKAKKEEEEEEEEERQHREEEAQEEETEVVSLNKNKGKGEEEKEKEKEDEGEEETAVVVLPRAKEVPVKSQVSQPRKKMAAMPPPAPRATASAAAEPTERVSQASAEEPTVTGVVSLKKKGGGGTRRLGFSGGARRFTAASTPTRALVTTTSTRSQGRDDEDTWDSDEERTVQQQQQQQQQQQHEEEDTEVRVQPRSSTKKLEQEQKEEEAEEEKEEEDEEETKTAVVPLERQRPNPRGHAGQGKKSKKEEEEEEEEEEDATGVVSFGGRCAGSSAQKVDPVAATPKQQQQQQMQQQHPESSRRALFRARVQSRGRSQAPPPQTPATPAAGIKCFEVNGVSYQKLCCIGKGGGGRVYKVMNSEHELFALKVIDLGKAAAMDSEAVDSVLNEVQLLRNLRGKDDIIQLVDAETQNDKLLIVLELGEIDLANLLLKQKKQGGFNENYIRLYWEQMLRAVHTIHEEKIVHGDLKPPNFLLVKGTMKLIDFGIAQAIQGDTTNISRDSQIGTLNYISPEALTETPDVESSGRGVFKLGRASDIWSLGIILYHMAFNTTPFASIRNAMQKMRAICNPDVPVKFPENHSVDPALVDAIQCCLHRNPRKRATIPQLLRHPFLRPTSSAPAAAVGIGGPFPSPMPALPQEGGTATLETHAQDLMTYVKTLASEGGVEPAIILEQLLSKMGSGGSSGGSSNNSSRTSSTSTTLTTSSSSFVEEEEEEDEAGVDGLAETLHAQQQQQRERGKGKGQEQERKRMVMKMIPDLSAELQKGRKHLSHVDTEELQRKKKGGDFSALAAFKEWMSKRQVADEEEEEEDREEEETTWK